MARRCEGAEGQRREGPDPAAARRARVALEVSAPKPLEIVIAAVVVGLLWFVLGPQVAGVIGVLYLITWAWRARRRK